MYDSYLCLLQGFIFVKLTFAPLHFVPYPLLFPFSRCVCTCVCVRVCVCLPSVPSHVSGVHNLYGRLQNTNVPRQEYHGAISEIKAYTNQADFWVASHVIVRVSSQQQARLSCLLSWEPVTWCGNGSRCVLPASVLGRPRLVSSVHPNSYSTVAGST